MDPPSELQHYRRQPGAEYDGHNFTEVKRKIKEQLLTEQGHLCAYCMRRIEEDAMKVEHWHSQNHYPEKQLDYRNLLGACLGNEGQALSAQTCDTRKGDRDLKFNPANQNHDVDSQVRYLANGKIESPDEVFDKELNSVLNLNHPRLVADRKSVVDAVHEALNRRPGRRGPRTIRRVIHKWSHTGPDGKLRAYCGAAVYLLTKRLGRDKRTRP